MNSETCQTIASILPIAMLTLALERRSIHVKMRKLRWFRTLMTLALVANLSGLLVAVVGVATNGLGVAAAVILWMLFAASIVTLGLGLVMIMATSELEEDQPEG